MCKSISCMILILTTITQNTDPLNLISWGGQWTQHGHHHNNTSHTLQHTHCSMHTFILMLKCLFQLKWWIVEDCCGIVLFMVFTSTLFRFLLVSCYLFNLIFCCAGVSPRIKTQDYRLHSLVSSSALLHILYTHLKRWSHRQETYQFPWDWQMLSGTG